METKLVALLVACLSASALGANPSVAWTPFGPLVGTKGSKDSRQGRKVALSGNGQILAVAGPFDDSIIYPHGAVWVFGQVGGKWLQQGPKITVKDKRPELFGKDVRLDYKGNTMVVASSTRNGGSYVFVRNAAKGTWSQKGGKLRGRDSGTSDISVAINADGTVIALGTTTGVFMFSLQNGEWKRQGPELTMATVYGLGESVALDAKGVTLVAGAPYRNEYGGLAVFSYSAAKRGWLPGVALALNVHDNSIKLGWNVAISMDGKTIASAGQMSTNGTKPSAVVWVVDKTGKWARQGPDLQGPALETPGQGFLESCVALSGNGSVLALGVPLDGRNPKTGRRVGSVVMFKRSRFGVWGQLGNKLWVAVDADGRADQGAAVALDAIASTLAVGAPELHKGQGGTWVWRTK